MKFSLVASLLLVASFSIAAPAQAQTQPSSHEPANMAMAANHMHHMAAAVPVTFTELENTASALELARRATAKYRDVRVAEADGYRAIGPDVPGMGIHFVRMRGGERSKVVPDSAYYVEHPDILLYENNPSLPGGFELVGVSYLLDAERGSDGQPKNPPFPKSLASWHRHADLCVFPDRSVKTDLSEGQCEAQGGRFTALTQWMVHAWIWKDSPAGVFSSTNPTVQ